MIFAYLQKHNLYRHTSSSTCPATYPRTNYQHPCETHLIIDLYVVIMILLRKPLDSYASLDQLWPLILCRDVIKPRINTYKPFFALKYIKYHHYGHLLSLSPLYILQNTSIYALSLFLPCPIATEQLPVALRYFIPIVQKVWSPGNIIVPAAHSSRGCWRR